MEEPPPVIRWIYGFRESGRRDLIAEERLLLSRLRRRCLIVSVPRFLFSVSSGFAVVLAIAFTAGGPVWGWLLVILAGFAFVYSLVILSEPSKMRLLCHRALRLGYLTRYEYQGMDLSVRGAYEATVLGSETEDAQMPVSTWADEERLIQRLEKFLGR